MKLGASGMDTVRVRFRGNRERYLGLVTEDGVAVHSRGEARRTRDGVTVGAFPDGYLYVEGRAAAVLNGQDDHSLRPQADLPAVVERARELAGAVEGEAAIGRLDLTSELHFADGRDGRELLYAASRVDVPWLKAGTEGGKRDALETVAWRTVRGRSVVLRLYDKGVETGQAGPGQWVRLERQRRYRKAREKSTEVVSVESFREAFVGRELGRLLGQAEAVHVADRWASIERLRELVVSGKVSHRKAESLAGYLALGSLPGERTGRRRAADLARLGVALDPCEAEPVAGEHVVEAFRSFCDAFAA